MADISKIYEKTNINPFKTKTNSIFYKLISNSLKRYYTIHDSIIHNPVMQDSCINAAFLCIP